MSAGRSTTAPGTLWTHIAGQRTMRWNTGRSPEEILLEREERAAHLRLLAAVPEACPMPLHPGPPRPGLLHRRYQPAENCPGWRAYTAARSALPSGGACGICAAAMTAFSRQSEGGPMQTINLKQYYPFCTEDTFVKCRLKSLKRFCWTSGPSRQGAQDVPLQGPLLP